MTTFPIFGLPVREGLELARRAVAALERQADLMTDPEPEEKSLTSVAPEIKMAYQQGKIDLAQELENILDAGWSMPIRQGELRKLVEKYAPKQMKDKK